VPLDAGERWKRTAAGLVALFGAALLLHAPIREFSDPDALYHARHAWIERTQGFWRGDFPWVQFSAIRREGSDLWYGFHVLLMPFTLGSDLLAGIRLAGIAISFGCLALVWAALRRLEIRGSLFWTIAFAAATGDSLFRITMVRPHPLSLGLALLLFAFACEERPSRGAVIATAALFAWIHMALAWVPVLLFLAVAGGRLLRRERPPFACAGWTAVGLVLGVVARPNPVGGLRLASIQVLTWLAGRSAKVPLDVGRELKPFVWIHFTGQLVPLTIVVAAAIALVALDGNGDPGDRGRRVRTMSALALLAIFAAMTFAVARRSNDFLVAFAAIFAGLAASSALAWLRDRLGFLRGGLLAVMAVSVVVAATRSVDRFRGYATAIPGSERLRDAAVWLRDHASEGDVVFNVHWDQFAPLFFWNPRCYYVTGNDPIFFYAFDPRLYGIAHQLESDALIVDGSRGLVREAPPGESGDLEELHDALSKQFHAAWILVQKARTPHLAAFLSGTRGFGLAYETPGEFVFRILP